MPFPDYDIATELASGVAGTELQEELKALTLASCTYLGFKIDAGICHLETDTAPDAADKALFDSAIASHAPMSPLESAKALKIIAIDARTAELIGNGFVYNSKNFSLSLSAQAKMIGTHEVKDSPALTYPIRWNTRKDDDAENIPDAATLDAFYLTALGTVRAHLDSGTALKDSVRAATTVAEVDAVVDNR